MSYDLINGKVFFHKYGFWERTVKILVSISPFKVVYAKNYKTSFSSRFIPHRTESINVAGHYIARENVCFDITYFYMTSNTEAPIANEKKNRYQIMFSEFFL